MIKNIKNEWQTWVLIFFIFSFAGWIYELFVYRFELGYGWFNRGFLFGPYLPVYGVGGLLMLFALIGFKHKRITIGGILITPIICFVLAVVIETAAELVTSYLMEMVIGEWLWDYTMDIPNFQGRIALKSSLRFGIMGIMGLYGVHPLVSRIVEVLKEKKPGLVTKVCILLLVVFLIDVALRPILGSNYVGP